MKRLCRLCGEKNSFEDVSMDFEIGIILSREFQHDPRGMVLVWPAIFVVVLVVTLALVFRSRKQRRELRSLGIRKEGIIAETYMGKTVKFSWSDIERVDFHRGKGARVELLSGGKYLRLSSVFPGFAEVREALSEACRENYVETKVIDHGGKEKKPWFVGAPKRVLKERAAEKREVTRDGRLKYIRFTRAVRKAMKGEEPGLELKQVPESLRDEISKMPMAGDRGINLFMMFLAGLPFAILILIFADWPQSVVYALMVMGGLCILGQLCISNKDMVRAVVINQQGFTAETFRGDKQHIPWEKVSRVNINQPEYGESGFIEVQAGEKRILFDSTFSKFQTMVEMVLQECAARSVLFYYSKWHLPGINVETD